jgi:hypothetical protein
MSLSKLVEIALELEMVTKALELEMVTKKLK